VEAGAGQQGGGIPRTEHASWYRAPAARATLPRSGQSGQLAGQFDRTRVEAYLGVGVDVEGNSLVVEGRDLGDVVVLALALLLLELERDAANGSLLDALHQVSGESSDLVAKALRGDDGDLIRDLLVGVEVESKAGVVLLDDHTRSTLDSLGANASPERAKSKQVSCRSVARVDRGAARAGSGMRLAKTLPGGLGAPVQGGRDRFVLGQAGEAVGEACG